MLQDVKRYQPLKVSPKILFEDEYMMAIEKPAGVVVNNAESCSETTIEDWVREISEVGGWKLEVGGKKLEVRSWKNTFEERAGIVHRLDRETSGILLVAKNEAVFDRLCAAFKNRQVQKKYIALVHGETEPEGMLNYKIARYGKKGKFVVDKEVGKDSLTEYKLIKNFVFNEKSLNSFLKKNYDRLKEKYDLANFSLVEIKLHTGRTHQIRVHFSHIHHPVAGDKLYGWNKVVKFEKLWCPRQFLHAGEIKFSHPVNNEEIQIKSELPNDLKDIMDKYL